LSAGACGYLLKSTPLERLLEAIQTCRTEARRCRAASRARWSGLSPQRPGRAADETTFPREQQVLNWLAEGFAYKQIASEMNLSMGTIRTYIRSMYEKLHVNSRPRRS